MKDGIKYFHNEYGDDSASPLNAARLFLPSKVNAMQSSAVSVDSLTAIPALHNPKPCIVVYSYTALSSDCTSL